MASRPVPYVHAWRKALGLAELDTTAKCLGSFIANYMSPEGWGYATDETLMRDVGAKSVDTISRARKRLKRAALVNFTPGDGRGHATEYHALIPMHLALILEAKGVHWTAEKGPHPRTPLEEKGPHTRRERSAPVPLKVRTGADPSSNKWIQEGNGAGQGPRYYDDLPEADPSIVGMRSPADD
jgi:hypothetical protein